MNNFQKRLRVKSLLNLYQFKAATAAHMIQPLALVGCFWVCNINPYKLKRDKNMHPN